MKALFTLTPAAKRMFVVCSLVSFTTLLVPHLSLAQDVQATGQDKPLVFEVQNPNLQTQTNETTSITFSDLLQNDPLVAKVQSYLQDKDSPLALSAAFIVTHQMWKRALAISVVESNMCRFTPKYYSKGKVRESYNCSGIGGDGFKRYTSYEDWFNDMNNLLLQPNYVNRPIEKFIGYYVVPGSPQWLYGVKKTERELSALEQEANQERISMNTHANSQLASAMVSGPTQIK